MLFRLLLVLAPALGPVVVGASEDPPAVLAANLTSFEPAAPSGALFSLSRLPPARSLELVLLLPIVLLLSLLLVLE